VTLPLKFFGVSTSPLDQANNKIPPRKTPSLGDGTTLKFSMATRKKLIPTATTLNGISYKKHFITDKL
jgi:hypothetical protein